MFVYKPERAFPWIGNNSDKLPMGVRRGLLPPQRILLLTMPAKLLVLVQHAVLMSPPQRVGVRNLVPNAVQMPVGLHGCGWIIVHAVRCGFVLWGWESFVYMSGEFLVCVRIFKPTGLRMRAWLPGRRRDGLLSVRA